MTGVQVTVVVIDHPVVVPLLQSLAEDVTRLGRMIDVSEIMIGVIVIDPEVRMIETPRKIVSDRRREKMAPMAKRGKVRIISGE